jgi:hypothetical protein
MKSALIFLGGVAVGLLVADQYAKWKVNNGVTSVLGYVGLGGASSTVAPIVSGLVG